MRLRRLALAGAAAGTIAIAGPALTALADGPPDQSNDACVYLNLLFIELSINLNLGPGLCSGPPVSASPLLSFPAAPRLPPAHLPAPGQVHSLTVSRSPRTSPHAEDAGGSPASVPPPGAAVGSAPGAAAGALTGAAPAAGQRPASVNPGQVSAGHSPASSGPATRQSAAALQPGPIPTAATGYSATVPFDRALSIPLQTPRMTLHQTILITTVALVASVLGGFGLGGSEEHAASRELGPGEHSLAAQFAAGQGEELLVRDTTARSA